MRRELVAGLAGGVAFLVLDGVFNANPLAQRLYAVYRPISRTGVNAMAGSAIDLLFGVVLAVLFVTLRASLPGRRRLTKGLSFGLMLWFLRVCMRVAGEWVTTVVPGEVHAYTLLTGLVQALVVATVIAWLLPEPRASARTDGRLRGPTGTGPNDDAGAGGPGVEFAMRSARNE